MPAANALKPHSRAHRRPGSAAAIVTLPRNGCEEEAPPMPAGRGWTDVERDRWVELWQSPQASQWDDSHAATVAMLIVHEQAILSGHGAAWVAAEARFIGEALGLTPRSMAALGWKIAEA
jgi:hypothetical protein